MSAQRAKKSYRIQLSVPLAVLLLGLGGISLVAAFYLGLVAGKSQTHFGWETIMNLHNLKEKGEFIEEGEDIPEPDIWFHDIFRKNGTAFDEEEVIFIKNILS